MFDLRRFQPNADRALRFACGQVRRIVERYPDSYPMYTSAGSFAHDKACGALWWAGFLPGLLWILHRTTGESWFGEQAERYSRGLSSRRLDRTTHDLGFLFMLTYGRWHSLSPHDTSVRDVLVDAGRTMALRFQPAGRYLSSSFGPSTTLIDIMMNVGLVFHAGLESGDAGLRQIAIEHCLTTRRFLVRGDGSVANGGLFDLATGEFLREDAVQGWRNDSCWSRGLAWSLYGFATAYRWSRDARFLQTAELNADYYLANVPDHGVPPWDFNAPLEGSRVDSSAAAIAASGLLDLAELASSTARGALYRGMALQILETLASGEYLAIDLPRWEGILRHGTYNMKKGLGVDESLIWGDYFFVEALAKVVDGENKAASREL